MSGYQGAGCRYYVIDRRFAQSWGESRAAQLNSGLSSVRPLGPGDPEPCMRHVLVLIASGWEQLHCA
jgi:hypothetical protein